MPNKEQAEDFQLPLTPEEALDHGLDAPTIEGAVDPDDEVETYRDGSLKNECWHDA